jgi:hypothetical protein
MRLMFEPDGLLIFAVGFERWNPARWRFDAGTSELNITIPRLGIDAFVSFENAANEGEIKRFDAGAKTIVYDYADSTDSLYFQGIKYYPEHIWNRRCGLPSDTTSGDGANAGRSDINFEAQH